MENLNFSYGSEAIAEYLRLPYIHYEKAIETLISEQHSVLELGSGSGLHTRTLLKTGAEVTASDIAPSSLSLLEKYLRPQFNDKLITRVADMEALPFDDGSFDVITCAGSLSYGDPGLVNSEIKRVLKDGGVFICVDSLNHNPIYKFNRYVQYLRGKRTKSTLQRMPDIKRIESLKELFDGVDVKYFGSLSWSAPLFVPFLAQHLTSKFFNSFDKFIDVKKSAFKFVFIGINLK